MKHLILSISFLLALNAGAQIPSTLPPAQATIDSIAQEEKFLLGVFNDHFHSGSTAQKYSKGQLDSIADRSIARNTVRWSRLSDLWISEYVPPVIPPPTGASSAIPASSVLVLYNTSTASTKARAEAYAVTWGIPAASVRGEPMGAADDLGIKDSLLNAVRARITASGKQWCVLVWDAPSRAGSMSITSALTFGRQTAYNNLSGALPTSVLYGYIGITPKIDKGVVPCAMLHSTIDIARTSTAKAPKGVVYMLAANDQSGQPRGKARLAQYQALDSKAGYTLINNTSGCAGECPGNMLTGKTDVLGYFGSMYKATGMETNTVLPGAYTDRVTSTSGSLPTGLGQTPCTYELGFGFAGSGGTVVEPWQNASGGSPGWLVEQFVNAQLFSAAYFDQGLSLGQAVWSAIKSPGRYLFLGDPMTTPKGVPTEATPPPTTANTFGPFTMTPVTCKQLDAPVLTSAVELTDFKPAFIGYGVIVGTGDNKPCLQMSPEGYLLWNGARVTTTLSGPMVAGQTYSLTATLPDPVSITHLWQRSCSQGGAQPGECKYLRLK